jgi:oligosaccharide 4-alpha-D-glucosyltransferase
MGRLQSSVAKYAFNESVKYSLCTFRFRSFCAEPKNEELYLRWLQFGVFNPIFRPHSEKVPSEPIFYSDSLQAIVRPFFELRYKLLPYNYTLAWKQEISGEPLASPLFIKAALPKTLWGIYDEYFWGDAFLVAPVLEEKQTEKEIFLPSGIWFDFFTEERHLGSSFFNKKLDYKTLPVFVKAGSFIPMTDKMVNTAFYDPSVVEVHFYYDATVGKSGYTLMKMTEKRAIHILKTYLRQSALITRLQKER